MNLSEIKHREYEEFKSPRKIKYMEQAEIIKKTEEFIASGKEIYFGKRLQSRSTVKKRTNSDNSHLFRSNQDAESNQ